MAERIDGLDGFHFRPAILPPPMPVRNQAVRINDLGGSDEDVEERDISVLPLLSRDDVVEQRVDGLDGFRGGPAIPPPVPPVLNPAARADDPSGPGATPTRSSSSSSSTLSIQTPPDTSTTGNAANSGNVGTHRSDGIAFTSPPSRTISLLRPVDHAAPAALQAPGVRPAGQAASAVPQPPALQPVGATASGSLLPPSRAAPPPAYNRYRRILPAPAPNPNPNPNPAPAQIAAAALQLVDQPPQYSPPRPGNPLAPAAGSGAANNNNNSPQNVIVRGPRRDDTPSPFANWHPWNVSHARPLSRRQAADMLRSYIAGVWRLRADRDAELARLGEDARAAMTRAREEYMALLHVDVGAPDGVGSRAQDDWRTVQRFAEEVEVERVRIKGEIWGRYEGRLGANRVWYMRYIREDVLRRMEM